MRVTITGARMVDVVHSDQRTMIEAMFAGGLNPDEVIVPANEYDHIMVNFRWAGDAFVNLVRLEENLFAASGVVAKIEAPTIERLIVELKVQLYRYLLSLHESQIAQLGPIIKP